jgi:hypothetical protein
MKAEELRIGNWVRIKDVPTTNEWQVESIGNLQQVAGQLWSIEELEPIPLTEEWLVKFGFDKVADNTWLLGDGFYIDLKKGHITEVFVYWVDVNSRNNFIVIKHVHSLQNLYFALTGEELNQNKEDE